MKHGMTPETRMPQPRDLSSLRSPWACGSMWQSIPSWAGPLVI